MKKQLIGPHGGHIVEDEDHRFEVKLDPGRKLVNVYTLRSNKPLPTSMSMTLFQDSSTGHRIDLEAVDPSQALPQYQGQLSVANASSMGIAIRFG